MTDSQEIPQPTREDVWNARSAARAFPLELVRGARTAISFFSAAFHGRNDVIYLDSVGVPDVVLVDLMAENLATMADIYPAVTQTYADDAFAVAERLRAAGRTFDVVLCDPFVDLTWPVFAEHFATFSALAGRAWVTGLTAEGLAGAGVPASRAGVQRWLVANGHHAWEAVWLEQRNRANGSYWLGLRRRPSRWVRARNKLRRQLSGR